MKVLFQIIGYLLLIQATVFGQGGAPLQSYKLVSGSSIVQSKNYYLLTLIEQDKSLSQFLASDAILSQISEEKLSHLKESLLKCGSNATCYTSSMKFSEDNITLVSNRLRALYSKNELLQKLVINHLIPSGTYILFGQSAPVELLVKAWEQDAKGLNRVIEIYGEGKLPNYPKIDSIGFNVKSRSFAILAYDLTNVVREEESNTLFFKPALTYALRFLEVNGRNEAADFEPMGLNVNKAAKDYVKQVKWDNFKYTLILIPGSGPDDPRIALSAGAMLRCRIGAKRYLEGKAPFIVVSGGRVHPYKTIYSEAFEMKKFLMNELHIPERAIIMDPHARHTTTNLRNTVRLLFRYGMPVDKPCLVSTMKGQSYYITNDAFQDRCRTEINHVPFKLGERLSETDFEFYPILDALHIDSDEPLDP